MDGEQHVQNVPLGPVDRRHAVRRHMGRRLGRTLRFHLPLVLGGIGVLLAGVGAWLSLAPTPVAVSRDAGAYTIGDVRLPARGEGTYAGPEGAIVIREDGGTVRAAASTTLDGHHMTGRCVWTRGADRERCTFTLERRSLSAIDTRTATGWHRRYGDGETVELRTEGPVPIPVPFAVGLRT